MSLTLQLLHHLQASKFVLIKEGEDWREEFNTFEEAMVLAAQMVSGRIPLIAVNEYGVVVSESTIETAPFRASS